MAVSVAVPKGLVLGFCSLDRRISFSQSVVAFAASHDESKHSEIDVERENGEESSNEEWKQASEAVREQALKMQSVSLEAYEIYSKKALVTLKETSEQLKIQAEMAKHDLIENVKEIGGQGKVYLSTAAENSSPEIKEIVETFSSYSADDFNDISKILDFHVGIPYGIILSVGGFLSFMLTGRISAIRFGVILGGALLA
ncbi:protein FATTY ACID EXPORT 3, chloroplastic-like [Hibiscus syriacus]|uniref:protein FATTY ACID EXPORT 3, chloroplastic-like n=1 Tax=Hibiscus syriacus TaxID=106335 RepID=UPI0019233571|nr:protein FATTY ACID EXPORT 3, chloroplastic-like [Hibiscus syriacus]